MRSIGNRGTGKGQKNKQEETQEKNPKINRIVGIATGGLAAAATTGVLISRTYEASRTKGLDEYTTFVQKSMLDQAYEVLSNTNIDRKIKQKTEEIASLKQKLNELETFKIKKKKREKLCNNLHSQIQYKSYCLEFLEKQKEKQESISQNYSKRDELMKKKEKTLILHPKKKSEISNEITICERSMENDFREYGDLEQKISENENNEVVLAREYEVMERKAIARKGGIVKVAVAVIGVFLICGIIAIYWG